MLFSQRTFQPEKPGEHMEQFVEVSSCPPYSTLNPTAVSLFCRKLQTEGERFELCADADSSFLTMSSNMVFQQVCHLNEVVQKLCFTLFSFLICELLKVCL